MQALRSQWILTKMNGPRFEIIPGAALDLYLLISKANSALLKFNWADYLLDPKRSGPYYMIFFFKFWFDTIHFK